MVPLTRPKTIQAVKQMCISKKRTMDESNGIFNCNTQQHGDTLKHFRKIHIIFYSSRVKGRFISWRRQVC